MRKMILLAFCLVSFATSMQASDKPNPGTERKKVERPIPAKSTANWKTFPGDMYFILFNDGCFHLGIEKMDPDGSVWWNPISGWPTDGYMFNPVLICMTIGEFQNFC